MIGRLQVAANVRSAQMEMDGVAARLAAAYPASNRGGGVTVVSFRDSVVEDRRKSTMVVLAGAVAFVLLIGCANIAGLLLTRMAARERERAVRIALGATRAQMISNIAAEILLLTGAGGALGFLLAAWTVPAIAASIAVFLPLGIAIELDRNVVLFAAGVSILSAILIAVIPAWQGANAGSLRGGRGAGSGAGKNRTRSILVVGEIALALVLLAGAGLMMKSVLEIGRQQPGFDPHNLLTLQYRVPRNKYPTGAQQAEFHREVVEQIKAVPGVVAAAAVRAAPLGGNGSFADFLLTDRAEPPLADRPRALLNFADPGFFTAMRIPVLRGVSSASMTRRAEITSSS